MNLLLIPLLASTVGWLPQGGAAPERLVICTEFTDHGNALLRTAVLKHAVLPIEIRSVRSVELAAGAPTAEAGETLAFVGYSWPLMLQISQSVPLASSPGLTTGRAAFQADDRTFEGLWVDPLGVAYHLGEQGGTMSTEALEGQLPERLSDLTDGRYEGLLLMEAPRADNATGALLTRIAGIFGGAISARGKLERLDANISGGYAVDLDSLLTRLTSGQVLFGVTTQRAALFWQNRDPEVRFRPVGDDVCALVVGASIALGNVVAADALWGALDDPTVIARISILENLVPCAVEVPASDLPVWAPGTRDGLVESDLLVAADAQRASGVVRYFRDEIQGVFASRRHRFSEYYDAVGILLVIVFVVWMLRRSAPVESAKIHPPESR